MFSLLLSCASIIKFKNKCKNKTKYNKWGNPQYAFSMCVSAMRMHFLHKIVSIKAIKIQLQQINRKKRHIEWLCICNALRIVHKQLFFFFFGFCCGIRSITTMANGGSGEYNATVAADQRHQTFKFPNSIRTFDSIEIFD